MAFKCPAAAEDGTGDAKPATGSAADTMVDDDEPMVEIVTEEMEEGMLTESAIDALAEDDTILPSREGRCSSGEAAITDKKASIRRYEQVLRQSCRH